MSAEATPPHHLPAPAGAARCRRPRRMLLGLPLAFAISVLAASGAMAQGQAPRGNGGPPISSQAVPGAPSPEAARPRLPKDKRTQLEGLFAALKVAPDERSAKIIADRLDQIFTDSGSATADVLMIRANAAAEAKEYDLALQLLDQVIILEPDYIGALSKRATILYMRDDYASALLDIREVLAREPRHYAMLYGLALIFRELDDDKRALEAVRRALAVNPRLDGAAELERQLTVKVEGRPI